MARQPLCVAVAVGAIAALSPLPCYAVNIVIDYSHDAFFNSHTAAEQALEAAATDLSAQVTTTLGSVVDISSATFNGATATFNFELRYTNPTTGALQTDATAVMPTDEIRIYAGVRNLTGTTLGQGGPGSLGWNVSLSGNTSAREQALAMAELAANNNVGRNDGPVMGGGSGTVGGFPYSIDYGSMLGSVWFDVDTDNNGATDTDALLNSYWHFDHNTPVAAGKADFYSVALHELMHALGIGTADSWDDQISNADPTDWLGSEVIALAGSGNNMVTSDGAHIASGKTSVRLSDGGVQEVVMDPSLTLGTRKSQTLLDLAFMRDIGWDTVSLELPGDLNDDGFINAIDIDILWNVIRPEVAGSQDPGDNDDEDLNGDGFVNEDDVDFLLANLLTSGDNRTYGDADLDGGVGGLDYTRWRERAGTGWLHGDFDGDGGVGGLDYTLWRTRPATFPGTVGPHSGGAGFGPAVVPEPGSIVLLLSGLSTLIVGTRFSLARRTHR